MGISLVSINQKTIDEILKVCRESYPNECCGILGGRSDENNKEIIEFHPAKNIFEERLRDRYEISPEDFVRIDKLLRKEGLDVIGFYHSHPDHPPKPSEFDRAKAWASYVYMIVAVESGVKTVAKVWALDEKEEKFSEDRLIIKE